MISFVIAISFASAVMAKAVSTNDSAQGFSYKYFWNLPMSKKSLLIGFSMIGVARVIPTITTIWVFFDLFLKLIPPEKNGLGILALISIDLALISIIISLSAYQNAFTHRRRSNENEKLGPYGLFLYSTLFLAALLALRYVDQFIIYSFEKFFNIKDFDFSELVIKTLYSPYNILFFSSIILTLCYTTLKYQKNEIHNYKVPLKKNQRLLFSAIATIPFNFYILFFTENGLGPDKQFVGHPLLMAIESKDLKNIKFELSKINEVNFENKYQITPMYAAISTGNLEIVKLIEDKGGHFKARYSAKDYLNKDDINVSAYDIAVGTYDFETIKYVAEKNNISLNEFSKFQGGNPLHLAAKKCDLTLARRLIAQNVDLNSPTPLENNTPLMLATLSRCSSIVLLLLNRGADRNLANLDGKKAIDFTFKKTKSDKEIEGILREN